MRALFLLLPLASCSLLVNGVDISDACGNNVLQAGLNEECDDGNAVDGDGCTAACVVERCGDGVDNNGGGEECDDGALNSDTNPDACRTDCRRARCGDGAVDTGEQCDDENTTPGDGCSALCQSEILTEVEPNDTIGTAQLLTNLDVGGKLDASLSSLLDIDFYQLTLTTTTSLVIEITEATSPAGGTCTNDDSEPDTVLYLFNEQGQIIAENDDSGPGNCSQLLMSRLAPGNYFIRANDFGFQEAVSSYRLDVDVLSSCGDGAVGVNEECELGDANCQNDCTDGTNCPDGILDVGEQCDDGNGNPNDGCDVCQITAGNFFEQEPNDDAHLEENNAGIGNGDFSLVNALAAQGGVPFTAGITIHGTMLINGGDEDYFLAQNTGAVDGLLDIQTADPLFGFSNSSCGPETDTNIEVFRLAGSSLGQRVDGNDDSNGIGLCSLAQNVPIAAGETLVIQITEAGDDDAILSYLARLTFH